MGPLQAGAGSGRRDAARAAGALAPGCWATGSRRHLLRHLLRAVAAQAPPPGPAATRRPPSRDCTNGLGSARRHASRCRLAAEQQRRLLVMLARLARVRYRARGWRGANPLAEGHEPIVLYSIRAGVLRGRCLSTGVQALGLGRPAVTAKGRPPGGRRTGSFKLPMAAGGRRVERLLGPQQHPPPESSTAGPPACRPAPGAGVHGPPRGDRPRPTGASSCALRSRASGCAAAAAADSDLHHICTTHAP